MAKRVVSFFLALVLSLAVSVPSFAFEVATSSNAEPSVLSGISTGIDDAILSIRPFSSVGHVQSTVSFSNVVLDLQYNNTSSVRKIVRFSSNGSGHYSLQKPSDYPADESVASPRLAVIMSRSSLPGVGTYQFELDIASATHVSYDYSWLYFQRNKDNVRPEVSQHEISVVQNAGDLYTSSVVDFGSGVTYFSFYSDLSDISFPLSCDLNISFVSVDLEPDISSPGASNVSQDLDENISNSVGQISSSVDFISSSIDSVSEGIESINTNTGYMVNGLREMANTLEEIVATISNQLSALWDQLYNNMHLPQLANDDKNTELIVEAIDDIELDISADLEAQTDSINQNNDKNTDTIVNGYDSSSLDASNDALSSAMESQEAQEEQILEQISEPLEDFEFDNPITQYLSAFQMFGDFLQDLFVGSGGFKDVINLSFLMPIALIVIGMYRFKGGG